MRGERRQIAEKNQICADGRKEVDENDNDDKYHVRKLDMGEKFLMATDLGY